MLTGPLSIPHVFDAKNRLFFMVNKEWFTQLQVLQGNATLPTAAVSGRRFQQFHLETRRPVIPIYDPSTGNADGTGRKQFPGNVIPANRIDPTSASVLKQFYHPATTSAFTNNFTYPQNQTDDHYQFTVRGDFNQSAKLQWAFRFSDGLETVSQPGFPGAARPLAPTSSPTSTSTWPPTPGPSRPRIVNVFTLGYTDFYNSLGTFSQGKSNGVGLINAGIPNLQPGASATWGIPSFSFTPDPFTQLATAPMVRM